MVPRCGYFSENGLVVRKTVYIDWDLGFTKEAKHEYIRRLHAALGDVGRIADVTSASPVYDTRILSPIFVKVKDKDMTVEEFMQDIVKNKGINLFTSERMGLTNYIYLHNLSDKNIETLMKYDCYTDVFNNPSKGYGNSQAESLAVYRALEYAGKLDLLNDGQKFVEWYYNELEVRLIQ